MTRVVADAALLLEVLATSTGADSGGGGDGRHYVSRLKESPESLRIGIPIELANGRVDFVDPEVLRSYQDAVGLLRELRLKVQLVKIPDLTQTVAVTRAIVLSEAATYHEQFTSMRALYGPRFWQRLAPGYFYSATDYLQAQRLRSYIAGELNRLLQDVDIIITPTMPIPAPEFSDPSISDPMLRQTPFNALFSLGGQPALSVPCGMTSGGLPIGVTFAGRPNEDGRVLSLGHHFEEALGLVNELHDQMRATYSLRSG